MIRYCLILLMLSLAGCDERKAAPGTSAPVAPAPLLSEPEPSPTVLPEPELEPEPEPAAQSTGRPQAPAASAVSGQTLPAKPLTSPAKPPVRPARKVPPAVRLAEQQLPPLTLDLRLPHELVEQLEPGQPIPDIVPRPALLPPLFVEKPAAPSAFQLSGKLITNDLDREKLESDNYFDKVEGAQLNFEFHQ